MTLSVSAIIPTFNRAAYLRKALRSLREQTLPRGQYEILVIDNASSDDTRAVVEAEQAAVPNVTYIYEPRSGANISRNTGWQHAQADTIAYLDDDAIVAPDWLEQILRAFQTTRGERVGAVGGRIEPIWEAPPPAWLDQDKLRLLALLDYGDAPLFLPAEQWLYSANLAVSRAALEQVGGFNPKLDRAGGNLLSNGEIMLERSLLAAGYRLYYSPQICVQHHMQAERLTPEWFVRRVYWQGVSNALVEILVHHYSRPRRLAKGLVRAGRYAASTRPFDLLRPASPSQLNRKLRSVGQLGGILGILGLVR